MAAFAGKRRRSVLSMAKQTDVCRYCITHQDRAGSGNSPTKTAPSSAHRPLTASGKPPYCMGLARGLISQRMISLRFRHTPRSAVPSSRFDSAVSRAVSRRPRPVISKVISMAVPKRKHSNSRSGKRRSHNQLKAKELHSCPKCGTMAPTHVVCPNENCGHYMGRPVVEPVS